MSSTRLDRVQWAIMEAVRLIVPDVSEVWSRKTYPRKALGQQVVTCRIQSGPNHTGKDKYGADEPTRLRWRVTGVEENDRVGVAMTGAYWYEDVTALDDDESVRDRLLAQFAATAYNPVLALGPDVLVTAESTNEIVFEGPPGTLWGAAPLHFVEGQIKVELEVEETIECEINTSDGIMRVEFNAFVRGEGGTDAQAILSDIGLNLSRDDVLEFRQALGVAFKSPLSDPIDLSQLAGPDWEARATANLVVGLRSYSALPREPIEEGCIDLNPDPPEDPVPPGPPGPPGLPGPAG